MTFVSLKKRTIWLNIAATILVAFIIANLAFIWVNSSKVDKDSNKESTILAEKIVKTTTKNYDNLPKAELKKKIEDVNNKIRSTAHFTEFIPLGLFAFLLCISLFLYKNRLGLAVFSSLLSVVFCALCALTDEIHQIFVKGRAFEVGDILVDTLGSIVGIAFGILLYFVIYRIKLSQRKK